MALENLDLLIPEPVPTGPSRRKGTVTGVSPVRIQLDGDTSPLVTTPDKLCSVAVGDRVYVEILGRQLIILGVFESQDMLPGDVPVGSVLEFAGPVAPPGYYRFYGGEAISRVMYARLFAVIGTTHGAGDGSSTFNLPNKRGRAAVGVDPANAALDTVGKTAGNPTVTLTVDNLPPHSHDFTGSGVVSLWTMANSVNASGDSGGFSGDAHLPTNVNITVTGTTDDTGGGVAVQSLSPVVATAYIIKI